VAAFAPTRVHVASPMATVAELDSNIREDHLVMKICIKQMSCGFYFLWAKTSMQFASRYEHNMSWI
jgi:hypothetical protein